MNKIKILIIGAGPCGLGAAYRLHEQNFSDFLILEKENYVGGLSASFIDEAGFTWDIGGHVLHSHYDYFDRVFEKHVLKKCYKHQRSAWVHLLQKFIPYPFQNNLRYLPKDMQWECVKGLINLQTQKNAERTGSKKTNNYKEWLLNNFGKGIAKHLAFPLNKKQWAHPLNKMSADWLKDRVSAISLKKTLENIFLEKDDKRWGPNNIFYFPKKEGTAYIWQTLAKILPKEKIQLNSQVAKIDVKKKIVTLKNKEQYSYDQLISTIPLTQLLKISKSTNYAQSKKHLAHSSTHVVGLCLKGQTPTELKEKAWIYFPENNSPFFRVTVFSNYSKNNVADAKNNWSLMCEVAGSKYRKINKVNRAAREGTLGYQKTLAKDVIKGALTTGLISNKKQVINSWVFTADYGYPTPTLTRDKFVHKTLKKLDTKNIYSRGRFGAWKYEVGNMDHTFMQGVEVIDRILKGKKEVTIWEPNLVNQRS